MRLNAKRDYYIIVLLLLMVLGGGFLLSNRHQRLETVYPAKMSSLGEEDFLLYNTKPNIQVGQSTGEEVQQVYPRGKTLGMSSVYRPEGLNAIFTFTKKSNVLSKVDIIGSGLSTSRGIAVNDSFDKVVKNYGPGYVRSFVKSDPDTFDAIYGSKHYIVFHVNNERVKKIVLDYKAADKGK